MISQHYIPIDLIYGYNRKYVLYLYIIFLYDTLVYPKIQVTNQVTNQEKIMRKKFLCLMMVFTMSVAAFTACGSNEKTADTVETEAVTEEDTSTETEEADGSSDIESATDTSKPTTDRSGNAISVPADIERIISMAPSTTRFLIDLGLSDKIVAIDTNSYTYLDSLPSDVQQFDMMAPDNEALIALEPDIIFTSGMSSVGGDDVYQSARDAGICVADIPSSTSFSEIMDDLQFIGDCVGDELGAADLIEEMNVKIDDVKAAAANVETKKTVLFEISLPSSDYPSIYTFGTGTYLDEMITSIGAVNITGDQESWISISEEEAIALNPDVIVTNVNYIDDVVNVIKSSEGWENVTAIQNGAVYYIDADTSNQPNNHVVDAMIQMAKQIYPDVFADFEDPFAVPASAGDAE